MDLQLRFTDKGITAWGDMALMKRMLDYPKKRNEILRATKRLGRSVCKTWSGYHRRSLVETKMRCLKLLGERISAKTFERQVTEVHIRVALLNRFTHLGTPRTVPLA
jgi:hypothetical protein